MREDIRFALRQFAKQPGFAFTAVLLLSLGIGASTAVFCVLYQALLKPLPYPAPQELQFIHNIFPKGQISTAGVSAFDYAEIRKQRYIFSDAGIFYYNDLTLTGAGPAQHIDAVNASASLFSTFAVNPQIGRLFTNAEDQAGAAGVALLSDALWRENFGADPHVVNRGIRLNGRSYSIVGVMPRGFSFPSRETQLWIPMSQRASSFTIEGGHLEKWLHMVARLAPNVTEERANAALAAIGDNFSSRYGAFYPKNEGWHFSARPLGEELTQSVRRWLYLAFAAVFAVLLIVCINVSGLVLIRGSARHGEMAIRLALGASRARTARQMVTETAVLTGAGCLFGILLALGIIHLINLYGPMTTPTPLLSASLLFAPFIALVSTLLVAALPAILAGRVSVDQTIKGSAVRTSTRSNTLRDLIMAGQIALALALLFIALQMNRSFLNLTQVPTGFRADHVWTGAIEFPGRRPAFFGTLVDKLATLPGVRLASAGSVPFNPSGLWTEALNLPDRIKASPPPEAQIGLVLPRYFETIGIPLLRGRTFTSQDRAGAPLAAVIDQELARRYFANENPIGQQIGSGGGGHIATIIGVVGTVHNSDLGGPAEPEVYYSELQEQSDSMYLVLRTEGDMNPTEAVRRAVASLDPEVALHDTQFMEDRVAASLNLRHFIASLLNDLAFTGLILAIVGLYGSLAHLVEIRQREIGIRAALGATRARIVRLIVVRGVLLLAAGMSLGSIAAIFAGRAIESQLFGVGLADTEAWLGVLAALLCAGTIAAYSPACRAARIEPAVALRHE